LSIGPSTPSMVPRTRTVGDCCWARVVVVASSRAKPAAPKARRVIPSIMVLPNFAGRSMPPHPMKNPSQSCLFRPSPAQPLVAGDASRRDLAGPLEANAIDLFVIAVTSAKAKKRHTLHPVGLSYRGCGRVAQSKHLDDVAHAHDDLDLRQPCGWFPSRRLVCRQGRR